MKKQSTIVANLRYTAVLAFLALSLGACSRVASPEADDFVSGDVNTGVDQDLGTVNTGTDVDLGAINPGITPNQDGTIPPGSSGLTKPDGSCINDTDGDLICNEVDPDIDNDGIPNAQDSDINGDGIANVSDPDMDGDGIANIDDNDIDGDGIANVNDNDIDGDGIPNTMDPDLDNDGVANIDDNDIDGDGVVNVLDPDVDGDGIANTQDPDVDGDGVMNDIDNDTDGDGIPDTTDPDTDNDGVPNVSDPDANGDGVPDVQQGSSSSVSGKLAYFEDDGVLNLQLYAGQVAGTGTDYADFADIRDSAAAKNADVKTINPYDVEVKLSPASAAALAAVAGNTYQMKVYYQLPGQSPTLIGRTNSETTYSLAGLATGIHFDDNSLLPTENFAVFQGLMANPTVAGANLVCEIVLGAPLAIDLPVELIYTVRANAKVNAGF